MTHRTLSTRARVLRGITAFCSVMVGLLSSLHLSLACWSPDSDIATPSLLWDGLRQDGFRFLFSFHYTPDNWLLWPFPLFCLMFTTLGNGPKWMIGAGWALFVGCAMLAGLIVRRVSDSPVAGTVTAVLLLASNRSALGAMGFLSYPVTHNATLLGGLAALLVVLHWSERGGMAMLAVAAVMLLICGASDPWLLAVLVAPLILIGLFCCGLGRPLTRARGLALTITMTGVAEAIRTQVFGLLDFVPRVVASPETLHGVFATVPLVLRLETMWLNVVPTFGTTYLWQPGPVAVAMNAVMLGAVLVGLLMTMRSLENRSTELDLVLLVAAVSITVTVGAFIGIQVDKSVQTGRYFMGCYVLLLISLGSTVGRAWSGIGRLARAFWILLALLFSTSGLSSGISTWWTNRPPPETARLQSLIRFLEHNDLRLGLGSYFGAEANAVTWISRSRVVMRPIIFSEDTGFVMPRWGQTAPAWYTQEQGDPGQPIDTKTRTFLVIGNQDDTGCLHVDRCVEAAQRQFGPALQSLRYDGSTILIWDYPLLLASPAIRAAHIDPLPLGRRFETTARGDGGRILGNGWSVPEAAGTWSEGRESEILLRFPPGLNGALRVELEAVAFVHPGRVSRRVLISLSGRPVGDLQVTGAGYASYTIDLPAASVRTGSGVLKLAYEDPISPVEVGISKDQRKLAISLRSVRLLEPEKK